MSKSYSQLQQQIEILKSQADALHAKEVRGVVARIREAITHYGLTLQDIFGGAKRGRKPMNSATKSNRTTATGKSGRTSSPASKRPPIEPKYTDGAGKLWSGRGRKPAWYVAGLESGKSPGDMLIKK